MSNMEDDIARKLELILQYKEEIRNAINIMGGDVGDEMSEYADAIKQIKKPFVCNIMVTRHNNTSVNNILFELDLTKYGNSNMAYQYSTPLFTTENIQIKFIISDVEKVQDSATSKNMFRYCIKCYGGDYDGFFLTVEGVAEFTLGKDKYYWYSTENPKNDNEVYVYRSSSSTSNRWKTDNVGTGNPIYANGTGLLDGGIIMVKFEKIDES